MAIFMFSIYFSPTVVGLYSLANRVLRQPIITLSESVQNVYFQKSAEQTANNINIKYGFMKTTLFLVMIGFIPFTILLVFGEKLFVIIFGVDWAVAGFFVQIMTPWFFFLFLNSPGNVVFEVCKKQDLRLKINIIKGVLRFIGLFVGCAIFKDPVITLAIFIVISTVFELISLYFAFDLARANI
jgi:O-antigen/teichoic acid export membrane protein